MLKCDVRLGVHGKMSLLCDGKFKFVVSLSSLGLAPVDEKKVESAFYELQSLEPKLFYFTFEHV